MEKLMTGPQLVVLLGWDLDAFWRAIESAEISALTECLAILRSSPDDEPDKRVSAAIQALEKEKARRPLKELEAELEIVLQKRACLHSLASDTPTWPETQWRRWRDDLIEATVKANKLEQRVKNLRDFLADQERKQEGK